jgi:hypothetical protein
MNSMARARGRLATEVLIPPLDEFALVLKGQLPDAADL